MLSGTISQCQLRRALQCLAIGAHQEADAIGCRRGRFRCCQRQLQHDRAAWPKGRARLQSTWLRLNSTGQRHGRLHVVCIQQSMHADHHGHATQHVEQRPTQTLPPRLNRRLPAAERQQQQHGGHQQVASLHALHQRGRMGGPGEQHGEERQQRAGHAGQYQGAARQGRLQHTAGRGQTGQDHQGHQAGQPCVGAMRERLIEEDAQEGGHVAVQHVAVRDGMRQHPDQLQGSPQVVGNHLPGTHLPGDPEIDGCRNGQRHPGQNGHGCRGCGYPRLDPARRPRGCCHQQHHGCQMGSGRSQQENSQCHHPEQAVGCFLAQGDDAQEAGNDQDGQCIAQEVDAGRCSLEETHGHQQQGQHSGLRPEDIESQRQHQHP